MDTVYPEPLERRVRRARRGGRERHRTQPVTFAEIKEVDEENIDENVETKPTRLDADIDRKLDEFRRLRLRRKDADSPATSAEGGASVSKRDVTSDVNIAAGKSVGHLGCFKSNPRTSI